MAKAKKTVKAKPASSSQPRWSGFTVGKRVQVVGGDYSNARGKLVSAVDGKSHAKVLLDQMPRGEPVDFHADYLSLLPTAPNRRVIP